MTTRGEEVAQILRQGIQSGIYPAGSRMNAIELSEALGVSRTPVQTALAAIAAEGLLDYMRHCGFVVRSFTADDIAGIYEVRATLGGLAARLAAERGPTPDQSTRINALLSASEVMIERHEWSDSVRAEWEKVRDGFFELIVEIAGNAHLSELLQRSRAIPLLRQLRFRWFDIDQLIEEHQTHREIAAAVQGRQQMRAESLYRERIYRVGRSITREWRKIEQRRQQEVKN
jgi:GntR family transcriptional regulator of vanillate catabolism